jgi:hypothetical protein
VRPPSTITFITASTKIGEIPETKWPDRTHRLAAEEPSEIYTSPPPVEAAEPQKKRGLRFWKREDKRLDIAVY